SRLEVHRRGSEAAGPRRGDMLHGRMARSNEQTPVKELADTLAETPADTPAARRPAKVPPGMMIQHYELIRMLGAGGRGEAYLAGHPRLGRLVALKFLVRVGEDAAARFVAEARATARLAHESIVALYDIAEHRGVPYIVLEYLKGRTLAEWLKS